MRPRDPSESFAAFSKRILAANEDIIVKNSSGLHRVLAELPEADQKAYVDRWYADGQDPTAEPSAARERSAGTVAAPVLYQGPSAPGRDDAMTVTDARPPRAPSVEIPLEYWVGWVVRPHDGGWKLRRIRIPVHVLSMFTTDQDRPADRRELVSATIVDEVLTPNLSTRTDWGTPIGHTPEPAAEELVDMVDRYEINQVGNRVPVYRKVPRAAYEALPEEVRAEHRLR